MTDNKRVMTVLARFAAAKTHGEYTAAKRAAGKLDPIHQFAIVDAAIEAHYRIRGAA
jgi:hypothetical protein